MFGFSDKLHLVSSSFIALGLRIVTTLVMARLIAPEEYGVYMLVVSLPGLVGSLGDIFLPQSLVQVTDFPEKIVVDTAFAMGVALNVFYAVITVAGGIYLAQQYHDVRLIWVSAIVGVTGILRIIYTLQLACINRRMEFFVESRLNLVSSVSSAATGIAFALFNWGMFAIALQVLASQLISNVAIYRREPLRWPGGFRFAMVQRFLSLGGKATIAGYFANVKSSVVNLLISGTCGDAVLGAWGRALTVQQLFSQNVIVSFERVIFPSLCAAKHDEHRLRFLFEKSFGTLMLFSAFAAAWLIVTQKELVTLLLGNQWTAVPPILAILAFGVPSGAIYSMGNLTTFALSRTGWLILAAIINALAFFPFLTLASKYGIVGIGTLWVVSQYVLAIATVLGLGSLKLPYARLLLTTLSCFGAAFLAGVVMHYTLMLGSARLPAIVNIVMLSAIGGGVYFVILWCVQRDLILFSVRMARRRKIEPAEQSPVDVQLVNTETKTSDLS